MAGQNLGFGGANYVLLLICVIVVFTLKSMQLIIQGCQEEIRSIVQQVVKPFIVEGPHEVFVIEGGETTL